MVPVCHGVNTTVFFTVLGIESPKKICPVSGKVMGTSNEKRSIEHTLQFHDTRLSPNLLQILTMSTWPPHWRQNSGTL